MNNQHLAGDQFIQLQNIAYVKQFMQKGSIKVLFLVSLLLAIANGILIYSFKDLYQMLFEVLQTTTGTVINPDESLLFSQFIDSALVGSAIFTVVFMLILPISLLYIIIRSKSENPTVIPAGAVKFLYVISFIQTIFVVISAVFSLGMQILSIFATESVLEAIISTVSSAISLFFSCLYYILQTQFLKAVKHSSTGYSLIYGSSKGFGIMSVLYSVFVGVVSAILIIFYVVFYSLLSSNSFDNNNGMNEFFEMGGVELFNALKPIMIMLIIISILQTLYYALLASVAFSYKEMVQVAVRESFMSSKRTNTNTSSAFRTYGGNNSYTNYNYSASNAGSQQTYAHSAMNTPENNPVNNPVNNPINTAPDFNEAPINENNYNAPEQYNEPFSANGSFTPTQPVVNNNINNEPVTTSGSFGFQDNSNNNN